MGGMGETADLYKAIEAAGPRAAPELCSRQFPGLDASIRTTLYVEDRGRRDFFIKRYGWAVPSREAIAQVAAFIGKTPTLEVGAGKGLWACLLTWEGVKIVATDRGMVTHPFYPVWRKYARAAVKASPLARCLVMVWPPYDTPMAAQALAAFRGDALVYVGEEDGGCTGDDRFHELLGTEWTCPQEVAIPQWWGLHDRVCLYERAR